MDKKGGLGLFKVELRTKLEKSKSKAAWFLGRPQQQVDQAALCPKTPTENLLAQEVVSHLSLLIVCLFCLLSLYLFIFKRTYF